MGGSRMKKQKQLKPEPTEIFGGTTATRGQSVLVSKDQVENMIDKLGMLQQDLIYLADPRLCRTFLPQLQNYLNVLVRRVSKHQLRQMSDMISAIREMMLDKVHAGVEHFSSES